jgi:membrane-associated phospholipid phosphatase
MDNWFLYMFNAIGMNSGYLLAIVGIVRLYKRVRYLFAFLVLYMINVNLIRCAKMTTRNPRPVELVHDKTDPEYYGMPSGHAFHTAFITAFLWLVNPSLLVLYICIFVICTTLVERYVHKRHTGAQLFVGLVSGASFGYICVSVLRYYFENTPIR